MDQPEISAPAVKTATCGECGCTSPLITYFTRYYTPDGHRRLRCPSCQIQSDIELGWVYLKAMIVAAVVGVLIPNEVLRYWILGTVCGCLFYILSTPLHEMAHATVAWFLGMPVYKIQWGSIGRLLCSWQIGRCRYELRVPPWGGMTYATSKTSRLVRLRMALVIVAGPLCDFGLALAAWMVLNQSRWTPWLSYFAAIMCITSVIALSYSVYPGMTKSSRGPTPNDGLILISLLMMPKTERDRFPISYYQMEFESRSRRGDITGMKAVSQEARERFPDEPTLKILSAITCMNTEGWQDARNQFLELRSDPQLSPEMDAYILCNLATGELLSERPDGLASALEYSGEAYALIPWELSIANVHGAALIVNGLVAEGTKILLRTKSQGEELADRHWNALFLSLGYGWLGDETSAEAERKLASRCRSLALVENRLESEWGNRMIRLVETIPRRTGEVQMEVST